MYEMNGNLYSKAQVDSVFATMHVGTHLYRNPFDITFYTTTRV